MQVLIIEDEQLTAEDLASILLKMPENISIVKILSAVKEAVQFLEKSTPVDLIFCDVQLGDGHCFEIFRQVPVSVPVIFCTAYNEYALEAFKNNGVGYVLKPFSRKSIKEAIDKFNALKKSMVNADANLTGLLQQIRLQPALPARPASLLVTWKDKILPVKINDIALFSVEARSTRLITLQNQSFPISHHLDELEELCGPGFYRANRQYLVNRPAIKEVQQYTARKLFVQLHIPGDFDITIAKAKVPEFLSWLKS